MNGNRTMRKDDPRGNQRVYPLEGIRVLNLSTQVPGPYCSMLLVDLGVKIFLKLSSVKNIDRRFQ